MSARIRPDKGKLATFCRNHHIARLSFFGSVLRKDFRPDSDVDVLVEFEPGTRLGLIGMAQLELELSSLVGRKVDLRTPSDLSRYFRDDVLRQAEVQFAQGR
ncbi:MAG: nucleotidyltransferase family protein [Acidobacteriota bacterium]